MKKNQTHNFIIISLCFLLFVACEDKQMSKPISTIENKDSLQSIHTKVDSGKLFLKNGNIVLRTGNDVISGMFAQLNKTDQTFSHCGIAFEENGKWFVYHSIGGEDNPDAKLKRETFEHFISIDHNRGFGICEYDLTQNQLETLHHITDSFYKKEIPFDMKFDLKSNDRFYCAEMVYKAYQKALANDSFFNITNHNGFKYVSTDNIFVNPKANLKTHISYFEPSVK